VISACAFTKHKEDIEEALTIARRVYNQMSQNNVFSNSFTYSLLLSTYNNLLPKEDKESRLFYAKPLFQQCCQAGFINDHVLNSLRQTITENQYVHLLGGSDQRTSQLPTSWTRNVTEKFDGKRSYGKK
jgi:hypothetical protein